MTGELKLFKQISGGKELVRSECNSKKDMDAMVLLKGLCVKHLMCLLQGLGMWGTKGFL